MDPMPPLSPPANPHPTSLDDTIDFYIAKINCAQIFQVTLVTMAFFFEIQQTFITIFAEAVPKWSCINSDCNNKTSNLCQLPAGSWSWDPPEKTSIISEWSLQCSYPIIRSLPSTAFFIGSLTGGLTLATLSDSVLGRKKTVVFSSLIMSIAGILTAFSKNVWMYAVFRFISGFGRAAVGSTGMVLATEVVGKKFRERAGIVAYFWGSLGFVCLPGIGYWYRRRSWRWLYIWVSSPCLIYSFSVLFFGHESPRWLFLRRPKEEVVETLKRFTLPENRSGLERTFFARWKEWKENEGINKETQILSTLTLLLTKPWCVRRLTTAIFAGFNLGLVYYGMPLGLQTLSFNLYLSVALNGLSEFPAALLSFIFIRKIRRRFLILSLALISAASSLVCAVVRWKWVQISFELFSFFTAITAFDVYLIYVLELFPTCVRNSAMMIFRQGVMLGGAIGPLALKSGNENRIISYRIFSAALALCGLTVGFLPETKGQNWADSMEEEENREVVEGGARSA